MTPKLTAGNKYWVVLSAATGSLVRVLLFGITLLVYFYCAGGPGLGRVPLRALYAAIPDNAEAQIVDGLYKISSRFDKAQTFILAEGPELLTLTP